MSDSIATTRKVGRQTLASIKQDVFGTLSFVTLGISFIIRLMYPIILALNRGLIAIRRFMLEQIIFSSAQYAFAVEGD